jgi:hypothetical protein
MLLISLFSLSLFAQTIESDAPLLVEQLKKNLMQNLMRELKEGPEKALDFCHAKAQDLTQQSLQEKAGRYDIGRTSHKTRNSLNTAQEWMLPYLLNFKETKKAEAVKPLIHHFENGKKGWLMPIYVEGQCLQCHGEKIATNLRSKIKEKYPQDMATGFKLGDFRGFFWVKEK